jgi:hypothetical protein
MRDFLLRLYRAILLPAFGAGLLVFMWVAVTYQVQQEKITGRHEAVLHSQSLARTLAEHTTHLLRQTDHATQLFKLKYEETNGGLRLAEFARKNGLLDSLLPTKLDLPMAILDSKGQVIDSMNGYFAPDLMQAPSSRTTPTIRPTSRWCQRRWSTAAPKNGRSRSRAA